MEKLPDITKNFSEWYQEVIYQSELIDASPTRGCFVMRPYGYAVWENIQQYLDTEIKKTGTKNAYFPLLIPEAFMRREAKHVEGFSPELAVVTHGGGKELEEKLVVRPTSETIIYHMFARWITSWRDLPLKINQWANIIRWEMRTRPFIRSAEFLWQEGHTAHATFEEALQMSLEALKIYEDFYKDFLAVPVLAGQKTESERFAGGERTYTVEGMMPDGKALQMGTSHILAHSFPQAFEISFQDKDGTTQVPWCTSWGVSTRSVAAVIMTHGDNNGLIFPPRVAPIQVVIIPIYKTDEEKALVLTKAREIQSLLLSQNIRVILDDDDQKSPGAKYYHWELRGVPVRLEIGPKDLEKQHVVLVSRVEQDKTKKKQFIGFDALIPALNNLFAHIQTQLYECALSRVQSQWQHTDESLDVFGSQLESGNHFYQAGWCGDAACEARLKNVKGSIRCVREDKQHNKCFACGKLSKSDVIVAKAY